MTPSGAGDDGAEHRDDDGSWTSPPAPEDRLWRHPSELVRSAEVRRLGRPALSVVAGVLVGAALATAGVVLLGGNSEPAAENAVSGGGPGVTHANRSGIAVVPTASTVGTAAVGPSVAASVAKLSGAMVRVAVERDGATEWGTAFSLQAAPDPGGSGAGGRGSRGAQVVTAASLVRGASALSVVTPAGGRQMATLLGSDRMTGVAVLRFCCESPSTALVSAVAAGPGDVVLCVTAGRMAMGVVSATGVNRTLAYGDPILGAIATDLPAGPAALGAPVLDARGQIVGMVVSAPGSGPTLAVPISAVQEAAAQLAASGSVAHGWLGIAAGTAAADGLTVARVTPDSPAAGAGITPGDVIVAVDGRPLRSMADLQASVALARPGRTVTVALSRGPRRWSVQVVLGRLPDS